MWPAWLVALGETLSASEVPAALSQAGVTGESLAMANEAAGAAAGNGGLLGMFNAAKDGVSAAGAMDLLKGQTGLGSAEKVYSTVTNPNLSTRQQFDVLAPEAYKLSIEAQNKFNQLEQQGTPMQMPAYAMPYRPYQGGGINEILARQQGLLR